MKRLSFLLLPLLLAACASKPDTVELTDWQFGYNGQWYPATVPGFIHTDLMANELIPDPYYDTNEDSVLWVGDSVWVYQTTLCKKSLPKGDTLWLVFEGLAGLTDIRVANTHRQFEHLLWVPDADNMYREYKFPFPNIEDTIIISVKFLPLEDSLREANYGIPLPERRAFTRIAPYQQGWDWGPKLATCGIWKPVYITNQPQNIQSIQNIPNIPKVELHQKKDSIGQSFTFYKDGKPLFIKGANWIPVHSFPVLDSANKARYRYLLRSAKEAGFNMIRVWGGGIYEHDYFYNLCDSLGLMVWQDFIFAGTPYPDSPEMLASIREEARQQVSRLARHSCMVLWCGNNEVKNGWEDWGWQGQFNWTPEQRARLEKAMDTIFGYSRNSRNSRDSSISSNTSSTSILAKAVKECDPLQRPYITTSPLYGWGHPECVTHGNSHYWGVWWGEMPFEVYGEKTGRFMTEYGFQSYPLMSTLRQFCPEEQLHIDSPTLRNHQKHGRGREIIDKAMRQYYGFDSRTLNLEDYAYVSQLLQAWGVGYGIYQHISRQPHCMGTLYWQLNDCWPVASWSSIDYYGNWKALHYRAQALFGVESGKWEAESERWQKYYSVYPKDRRYPMARYNLGQGWESDGTLVVTLQALSDLYDVYLDTEPHVDGHFTTNFVDLKAGEKVRTRFVPTDPKADLTQVKVKARTLNELYQ
jgi:beta-mannosidase